MCFLRTNLFTGFTKNIFKRLSHTSSPVIDPIQDKAMDERCILVDKNDLATGYSRKRDCHRVGSNGDVLLHRAFSVFIFNSKNELLLQKRSLSKITFPGYVTNACCSHPLYDIDLERNENDAIGVKLAARRRLYFELGIPPNEVDLGSLNYLTRIHYKSEGDGIWGEHEIDYVMVLHKDVTLNLNSDEISDIFYVKKNEFDSFIAGLDSPITPWFNYIVTSGRLNQWWNNLHNLSKLREHDTILRV